MQPCTHADGGSKGSHIHLEGFKLALDEQELGRGLGLLPGHDDGVDGQSRPRVPSGMVSFNKSLHASVSASTM